MPTHEAASIWNGSHGPTPAVISAEANNVVEPSTNPNPGPNTRPPRMRRRNTVSMPPRPAPSGRSIAPRAVRIPSIATALASIPPTLISARTTATITGTTATNTSGASVT